MKSATAKLLDTYDFNNNYKSKEQLIFKLQNDKTIMNKLGT